MNQKLKNLIDFVEFSHKIREVKRSMLVKGLDEYENDAEHSYQLALIAQYIIEANSLELDVFKVMGLALVHDIVEVYAGDTFAYGEHTHTQQEREKEAFEQLKKDWPKQRLMISLIEEYETCESNESKFLYALDKLVPMMNNLLDEGRSWKSENIKLEDIKKVKHAKVSKDKTILEYYLNIIEYFEKNPQYFNDKSEI